MMGAGMGFDYFTASVCGVRLGGLGAVGRGWCLWAPVVRNLRRQLVNMICRSGAFSGLGGLRDAGMSLALSRAAAARRCVRWRPAACCSRGFFCAGSGVLFGGRACRASQK